MGTRADFYVGKGKDAEWIGSVAWDGYEWGERMQEGNHDAITSAETADNFRGAVSSMLASRRDGTTPADGWPWPWDDSCTTDCSYCFVDGKVEAFSWGCQRGIEDADNEEWPDMKDRKNVVLGGQRSGLIVFGC